MRHPALLIAFICVTVTTAFAEKNAPAPPASSGPTNPSQNASAATSEKQSAASNSWKALLLPREELPDERNALVRWRLSFDRLQPDTIETAQLLQNLISPIEDAPAIDEPTLRKWLIEVAPLVNELVLREGEALQLPVSRGPETPFPDHAPLRQLATVRVALMKAAWLDGRTEDAVALAVNNLFLARAFLGSQEGIIGLIQAAGVWQISLDGVYWLARQENLTLEAATRLQNELSADERLGSTSLTRAFRGEFTFFTHLVIERLPKTKDVNLLLGGIATLGMSAPEPTDPTELHLATPERDPFDREATLQLSANDVSGWITAFAKNRHPSGLTSRHTGPQLRAYSQEIEPLLRYATEEAAPTLERVTAANQTVATVENSVGKLFLVITTSQWEPLSTHVFRREAERSALVGLLAQRRFALAASTPLVATDSINTSDKTAVVPTPTAPVTSLTPPAAESSTAPSSPRPAAVSIVAAPTSQPATAQRFLTWEKLLSAKFLPAAPADPFTTNGTLLLDTDPLQPRIWSVGENGVDDGGQGSGENVGRPLDLTWPISALARSTAKTDGN